MEIIIGRDQQTRQLCVVKDGRQQLCGAAGSVPMDVSRHHLSLTSSEDGKWLLKNLNERNVTYANGLAIESKTVTEDDQIELGQSHYLFRWDMLKEPEVETIDISPLEEIWDDYNEQNKAIKLRQKNNGLLASIPMSVTMAGGIITSVAPASFRPYAIIFTVLALMLMIYGFYRRFTDNSIEEQEEIKKDLQRNYVCPKCGHFMGFQDYDLLTHNNACPYCKTQYKK